MSWIFFTVLAIFARAIYGVMSKVLSSKVLLAPSTQAFLLTMSGAFIAVIGSPLLGGIHLNTDDINLLSIAMVVLGQGLGNIVYFIGIKKLTSGTTQIAFSSILVFNILLSLIFLGLKLSLINVVGILLLSVAILLTSQVVVAVILSYIFLKEKDNVIRKIIAAILLIIAALLIKI